MKEEVTEVVSGDSFNSDKDFFEFLASVEEWFKIGDWDSLTDIPYLNDYIVTADEMNSSLSIFTGKLWKVDFTPSRKSLKFKCISTLKIKYNYTGEDGYVDSIWDWNTRGQLPPTQTRRVETIEKAEKQVDEDGIPTVVYLPLGRMERVIGGKIEGMFDIERDWNPSQSRSKLMQFTTAFRRNPLE
jgi:hypothetical protein